jgi:hypothetical protein
MEETHILLNAAPPSMRWLLRSTDMTLFRGTAACKEAGVALKYFK